MRRRLYVNLGAALSLAWEKALRLGEVCRGLKWDQRVHLSRMTIRALDARAIETAECILLQPPMRKTSAASEVAREKCNQPLVIDARSKTPTAFAVWGPRLEKYDPCPAHERGQTPAFRLQGELCLSQRQACVLMKTTAQECVKNWEDYDYGSGSLRSGRIGAWRSTNADLDDVLAGTTHTSAVGISPYTRAEVQKMLAMDREAETVRVVPVETVVRFDADRSKPQDAVYMTQDTDGNLVPIMNAVELDGLVDSADEGSSSDSDSEEGSNRAAVKRPPISPAASPSRMPVAKRAGTTKQPGAGTTKDMYCSCGCAQRKSGDKAPRGRPKRGMMWCYSAGEWVTASRSEPTPAPADLGIAKYFTKPA